MVSRILGYNVRVDDWTIWNGGGDAPVIADLVVTVIIYRAGGLFLAVCPEFGAEGTGGSPEEAKEEALASLRRQLDAIAARDELADFLAEAGFVVDGGVLRTERRLIEVAEGRVTVPF